MEQTSVTVEYKPVNGKHINEPRPFQSGDVRRGRRTIGWPPREGLRLYRPRVIAEDVGDGFRERRLAIARGVAVQNEEALQRCVIHQRVAESLLQKQRCVGFAAHNPVNKLFPVRTRRGGVALYPR